MRSSRIRWHLTLMLLIPLFVGCGANGSTSSGQPKGPQLTVAGSPSLRVTDTVGKSLTKEQRDELVKNCKQESGVPGTNEDCKNSMPSLNPPCGPTDQYCIYGGSIVGDPNMAVLKLVERGANGSTCEDQQIDVCHGIVVSRAVAAPLLGPPRAPSATPVTPTSPSPSTSEYTSPESTTPESTTPESTTPESLTSRSS